MDSAGQTECVTVSGLPGNITVRNNTLPTHSQGTAKGERERTVKVPGKYLLSVVKQ